MTYKSKQNGCPYRTTDGKCTHRSADGITLKKKPLCIYNDPDKCRAYYEWLGLRNISNLNKKSSYDGGIPQITPSPPEFENIIIPHRPNRCTICKKIISHHNKSGLCGHHARLEYQLKRSKKND